ncbi:sushi, von Willebrand factor type A, EGF and pentraxin domain-containing protein 1-like isoform X2 [Hypanus sabinus]|uniref:sushi, von Willebrand factor type A, EGF and pentraxin domain-containing protein 1-like isoform X2 n=1 Tax=Hypanus sabinus TaxID=79690 RepID=UPI0028C467DC|nr:sushi, von Willebrand factor type A, EGF and pentraxin domain-containing protein 1-like isoform X2 [Hypanus sabinus]
MKPFLIALLLSALVGGSQASDCGPPPDLENAIYTASGYAIGNWVHYACDEGYILYGRNRILCTRKGWSKTTMSCQKIEDPPSINNGTVTEGEERMHEDKEDHPNGEEIEDPPSINNGTVSEGEERTYEDKEDHPNGEEIKDPPSINNGTVSEGEERMHEDKEDHPNGEGNIVTDQATTHRMGTGAWSHPPPSSTEIKDPPSINNGTVTEGEERMHEDKEDHPNGEEIEDPPSINNGTVSEGEERMHEDKEDHPNGGNIVTDQATTHRMGTGAWSHPPPSSTEIKDPPSINNGTVTEGEERMLVDKEDHPNGEGNIVTDQATTHRMGTGAWSHPPPSSTEIKDPPSINNGTVTEGEERMLVDKEDHPNGEGNIVTDQATTHRMGTGAWSHPPPSSTEIKDPPSINNGTVTEGEERMLVDKEDHPNGEEIEDPPSINNGTVSEGEERMHEDKEDHPNGGNIVTDQATTHRMGTGAWSHPPPSSTEIEDPPSINNGTVSEGEERMHEDKEDHPNGGNIVTDQATTHRMGTGAWSHPPPSSTEIKDPPSINNGTVTEGEERTYGDKENYPNDKEIKCDHPPTINNGRVTEGEEWTYEDKENYLDEGTLVVHDAAIQEPEVKTPMGILAGVGGGVFGVAIVFLTVVFIKQRKKQGSYRLTLNDEEADSMRKLTVDP